MEFQDIVYSKYNNRAKALNMYYGTDEALEGKNAFLEKRKPDYGKYRR